MRRILPVLRVPLFASLCASILLLAAGCGLKGDLVLPQGDETPIEADPTERDDDDG